MYIVLIWFPYISRNCLFLLHITLLHIYWYEPHINFWNMSRQLFDLISYSIFRSLSECSWWPRSRVFLLSVESRCSIPGRVKPKTKILAPVASLVSIQDLRPMGGVSGFICCTLLWCTGTLTADHNHDDKHLYSLTLIF